jgi:hypothetical protein
LLKVHFPEAFSKDVGCQKYLFGQAATFLRAFAFALVSLQY